VHKSRVAIVKSRLDAKVSRTMKNFQEFFRYYKSLLERQKEWHPDPVTLQGDDASEDNSDNILDVAFLVNILLLMCLFKLVSFNVF